ncbi:hypothetical protein [Streptomyces cylindrosporus]|uniref:Uncharacterized protein n=1 Tax=Streptomyces cylindrosporus TaxID=2927583 RepID=A0ABS9Y069_9ACTN|nr:hypothetical protein [Streptomyces cylindrosporus]MCI3270607.1 hypothetical protein [Streptomyces cylindrosporus]
MSQQSKIRRLVHRLVQRYLRATAANASHGYIPLATGPFGALEESRRLGARQESGVRHG